MLVAPTFTCKWPMLSSLFPWITSLAPPMVTFSHPEARCQNKMYCGSAIFIDLATSYIDCQFQTHLNTHELCIPRNHSDSSARMSGLFSSILSLIMVLHSLLRTILSAWLSFNKFIISLVLVCITTMVWWKGPFRQLCLLPTPSAIHCPEVRDPQLWPTAMHYASYLYNICHTHQVALVHMICLPRPN